MIPVTSDSANNSHYKQHDTNRNYVLQPRVHPVWALTPSRYSIPSSCGCVYVYVAYPYIVFKKSISKKTDESTH